jgi:hypothetical protein
VYHRFLAGLACEQSRLEGPGAGARRRCRGRLTSLLVNGPHAVRLQKKLIRQWKDLTLSQAVSRGIKTFAQAYAGDEPARMMGAFTRRRDVE